MLLGRYSVLPCTEPFEVTANNIARIMGLANFSVLRMQYPIGSPTMPELQLRAEVA